MEAQELVVGGWGWQPGWGWAAVVLAEICKVVVKLD